MEKVYFKNGKRNIPYTFDELKKRGNLYKTDFIWHDGLEDWKNALDIEELKEFALSQAPLTKNEQIALKIKKSIKPTFITYFLYSLIIGILAGTLEKFQYENFFKIVNECSRVNEQKDIAKYGADYKTNPRLTNSGFSFMSDDEIYVTREDGSKWTRFKSFITVRGTDQEQVAYNENYKFLFRPYFAIFDHANLSIEERENNIKLLYNFIISALVSNIILIPLLMFGFYYRKL
jgi:hypothetical protein